MCKAMDCKNDESAKDEGEEDDGGGDDDDDNFDDDGNMLIVMVKALRQSRGQLMGHGLMIIERRCS